MLTPKFLQPSSEPPPEVSPKVEGVAVSIAQKETPLYASQANSAWEIFLGVMLIVAAACIFAQYHSIKVKLAIAWAWIKETISRQEKT